tara:strand:- start:929 stop:1156 length:228 start_codon:yes stop_codon:yes gene_type:complete
MSKFLTSNEFIGTKQLPINHNRDYLAIFATTGPLTIKFNDGTGVIPVVEGGFYEPLVAPTSTVEIVGSTFTVVEG